MKKLMHILFLSCLKATELIEKKMQFRLSSMESLQLMVHKSMCDACRNYEKQNYFIEKAITNYKDIDPKKVTIDMDSFKKIIIEKVEEQ